MILRLTKERTEMETLIRAQRELWNDTIAIHFAHKKQAPGVFCVAEPLTFKEHPDGAFVEPTMRLPTVDAQRLMDELWDCGCARAREREAPVV